jgi:hypothetical protein
LLAADRAKEQELKIVNEFQNVEADKEQMPTYLRIVNEFRENLNLTAKPLVLEKSSGAQPALAASGAHVTLPISELLTEG